MTGAGFPHSDIHGSTLGRQLPVASRSHPRPSSASGAKASTVGSSSLELLLDARARYGILKGSQRPRLDGGAGSHGGRRRAASPPEVSRAAPPDNGTEVGPTPPPATERSKPAIGGVREGLRRVIDSDVPPTPTRDGWGEVALLRKEVIQPHLPVRLPCYDFTPIAGPTFDGSLLAVGPPASGVTNFRGVTGGVYKARERIHPDVADSGLLATPTSRSRVADSDPN